MSVGKTNPMRQMMINMMYLVLTALLALNVSAEILKAFSTVNKGMVKSIELIDLKKNQNMDQFAKLMAKTPDAVKEYYDKANEVNVICNALYDHVKTIRDRIVFETGGMIFKEEEGDSVMLNDKDLEIAPRLFINDGLGDELQEKIKNSREELIKIVSSVPGMEDQAKLEAFLPSITVKAEEPMRADKTWAEESFNMVPSVAAVTLMTKIQQDIRTTQANILDKLINSIGAEDYKFDKLIPVVTVTTGKSAVAVGEKYTAEILLAAYDSKQQPKIFLDGEELEVVDGKAIFEGNTSSQMSVTKNGEIVVSKKGTEQEDKYEFVLAYDVFNAPAIISATKMNVVYIGLPNPMEISVPGYRPQDISATMSGGSLKQESPGKYIATVPDTRGKVREAIINVSVRQPDGGTKFVGKSTFRIKKVPSPQPYFGSKVSGEIGVAELRMVNFISVRLDDFPFDLKYKVTKFNFVFQPKKGNANPQSSNGPSLTQAMKSTLSSPQKGDMIIIANVWASAPGLGNKQLPGSIVLTVK
ncbi:gliding motility protein GldM [Bacteroidota bacterium]